MEMFNRTIRRRGFLLSAVCAAGLVKAMAAVTEGVRVPKKVRIAQFDPTGKRTGVDEVDRIVKPDAEWRKQLTPEEYQVTRREGTERAGTGKYAYTHVGGLYDCICCGTALFDSAAKFESGTGWPSFYQPLAKENIVEETDSSFGVERTKVSCRRCDAHLGHVFRDGPRPTGLRYCMNSASLNFAARAKA